MAISAMANPGDNILVPRPGFPLYKTLANGLGITTKEYDLLPLKGWECDLDHMRAMIDENTKAILVNNPSNPCGSVFSEEHLRKILALADEFKVPIIADEIYEHFVFSEAGKSYVPMASLTTTVPILSCGGLTKRYLVPGWRLGWITVHDRQDLFLNGGVRKGLNSLSQRIIGANTIVQGALPNILKQTPESFFQETLQVIEGNAKYAFERFQSVDGLYPVMPGGAMYMMVGLDRKAFPKFKNCLEIVEGMVREQSVFCLPGKCFGINDFFPSCSDSSTPHVGNRM
jgi:tyrosine aminotransferase